MIPNHVAIIMDGNGRWAQKRNRPRVWGHIRGSQKVRPIVEECGRRGVKFLTLFAFSSENWGRPSTEVGALMQILQKFLVKERPRLMANNVRLKAIGDLSRLPDAARKALLDTIHLTTQNTGLTLTFALSYGSRAEITRAVQEIAGLVRESKITVDQIDETLISNCLWTSEMPDPDVVIRTSGEQRISNFMLWQAAYSEFFFSPKMWPEFDIQDLDFIFEQFAKRTRRYGLTDSQIHSELSEGLS